MTILQGYDYYTIVYIEYNLLGKVYFSKIHSISVEQHDPEKLHFRFGPF